MQKEGNAKKPDPLAYIEKLREMQPDERLAELIIVRQKYVASISLGISDLVDYYGNVLAWLSNIVSFELNEAATERPDIYGYTPPPNYTTNIA